MGEHPGLEAEGNILNFQRGTVSFGHLSTYIYINPVEIVLIYLAGVSCVV